MRHISRLLGATVAVLVASASIATGQGSAAQQPEQTGWLSGIGTIRITRPETGLTSTETVDVWIAPDGRWRVLTQPASGLGLTSEWMHDGTTTFLSTSMLEGDDVAKREWAGAGHHAVDHAVDSLQARLRTADLNNRATTVVTDAAGRITHREFIPVGSGGGVVESYSWTDMEFDERLLQPTLVDVPIGGAIEGRSPDPPPIVLSPSGAKSHGTTLLSAIDSEQCLYIYNSRDPEADWLYGKSSRVNTCVDVEVRLRRSSQVLNIRFCAYGRTIIGTATGTYSAAKSSYSAYQSPTCTSHDAHDEDGFHVVNGAGYATRDWSD